MRGKVHEDEQWVHGVGITPAYAGKRAGDCVDVGGKRDHPCVCGEKPDGSYGKHSFIGSPLRMRGKVNTLFTPEQSLGITPASAGTSIEGRTAQT